jgi:pyruvate ferredoxin oxidoreductase beta subunit
MNTGIQKSSLTPFGAKTTTTPAGKNIHGNLRPKKNMFEIVAAHGITYAATASVGYLNDFIRKVEKASKIRGTKYIHVIAPCPTGWGIATDETIESAKEIVDCGLWYLAEYENGEFILNFAPKDFSDTKSYLKKQGRFKHLTEDDVQIIQNSRDAKWNFIHKTYKSNFGGDNHE